MHKIKQIRSQPPLNTIVSWSPALTTLYATSALAAAYWLQLVDKLSPCDLCMRQRYPLFGAVLIGMLAIILNDKTEKIALGAASAALITVSGGVGIFHAGVEYHIWQWESACTAQHFEKGVDPLSALMKQPIVPCDVPQWRELGISLAGWNGIISVFTGIMFLLFIAKTLKSR